jgi:hypothetical protein
MKVTSGMQIQYFVARHETFPPRYGWLKKAFDAVNLDPLVFESPTAIEMLGVGANMVRSMRFWGCAFGVIESASDEGPRRLTGPMRSTYFGRRLLSDDGWDPYLEDPASLWLLHWKLFVSPVRAISWSIVMNLDLYSPFDSRSINRTLKSKIADIPELKKYAASSINSDTLCFLRMYSPSRSLNSEEIECPFTQLGLITSDRENDEYQFNRSIKNDLPDIMLLACCLEYAGIASPEARIISTRKLAYDQDSPGRVFKMSENDVGWKIERVGANLDGVTVTDSYGALQVQFEKDPEELFHSLLERYYS